MNIINRITKKVKNKKYNLEPWTEYYSKEENKLKITKLSIYEYMLDRIGEDTDLFAINYFGTRITYKEMIKKINLIARSLRSLGVKQGDIVTICMPNTPEAVETFYAISKIGAVADMIHPLSSPIEIKDYLVDTGSRVLILYDANYEKVKDIIDETLVYKTILTSVSVSLPPALSAGYQVTKGIKIKRPKKSDKDFITWQKFMTLGLFYKKEKEVKVKSKDLALILHSGGTTGKSKGIMLSNYNFNAEAQQIRVLVHDAEPNYKFLGILPIFHGFGLGVCVHAPLTLKSETILIPEFDRKQFPNILKKYKPNVIAGVPTLWEAMLSTPGFEDVDLSPLKYIISGGDSLTLSMEDKMNNFLRSHNATVPITKGYGMTESVAASCYTIEGTNEPGSIGVPMAGNSFCICKVGTTEELPIGEEGEICVSGPTVMMGYLNNEKETQNVLKKHKDGKIWLHSGDIGYIRPNGVIYFTQRLKRMIISSGFNIYPSVIENVIEKHPDVKKCCVIGVPHKYKMSVAKAFISLHDGVEESNKLQKEIEKLCKNELAEYSQPKFFEYRKEIPQTIMKKTNYVQLEQEEAEKSKNDQK